MRFRLTLSRKAFILVAFPLVLELAFIGLLITMLQQMEEERLRELRARDIMVNVNMSLRYLLEAGSDSVIATLTGSKQYRQRFDHLNEMVREQGLVLKRLMSENATELASFEHLNDLNIRVNLALNDAFKNYDHSDPNAALPYWVKAQILMNQMFVAADDLLRQEETIMMERSQALARARNNLKIIIFLAVAVNIVLAVLLAFYFNKGTSRRLNVLMDNVLRLGARQELHELQTGDDEIAHLDQVFHEMAKALANAQKRERAIVDNAVDVICSVEPDGRITAVNPAAEKTWGYSPEDLIGSRLSLIISPDDIDSTISSLRKSIDEKSAVAFENRIRRKDGSLVDMLWSAYWSVEEGAIICVAHDITERKELDRMKQEFVAVVSHDLRTPLTSVQGFLSLLSIGAYNELSDGGKQSLAVAEAGIERLVGLVNDLLDLEKMEAGHMEVRPARLKVSDLAQRAIETMEQSARGQLVVLQSFVSYELSDIFADEARLMQVMVNLLSNAIKFAPSGSTISVEACELEEFIEIAVIDRGRGVPADLRTAIFEKFRQADLSDERMKGGTGLGLAICKAIVERHGGRIGVRDANSGKDARQNQAEPGSCFWFLVPKFQEVSKFSETSKSRME